MPKESEKEASSANPQAGAHNAAQYRTAEIDRIARSFLDVPRCTEKAAAALAAAVYDNVPVFNQAAKIGEVKNALSSILQTQETGAGVMIALSQEEVASIFVQRTSALEQIASAANGSGASVILYALSEEPLRSAFLEHTQTFVWLANELQGRSACALFSELSENPTLVPLAVERPNELAKILKAAAANPGSFFIPPSSNKSGGVFSCESLIYSALSQERLADLLRKNPAAANALIPLLELGGSWLLLKDLSEKKAIGKLIDYLTGETSYSDFVADAVLSNPYAAGLVGGLKKILSENPQEASALLCGIFKNSTSLKELYISYAFGKISSLQDLRDFASGKLTAPISAKELEFDVCFTNLNDIRSMLALKDELGADALSTLHNEFGITFFSRYNLETMKRLYGQSGKTSGKPIVLVFLNKLDNLGAFYNNASTYDSLSKSAATFFFEGKTEGEFYAAVKKIGETHGKISLIVLSGHGQPDQVSLGGIDVGGAAKSAEEKYIDLSDMAEIKANVAPFMVDENPHLVLHSCSGAAYVESGLNIANSIAKENPGLSVTGASGKAFGASIKIKVKKNKITSVDVKFGLVDAITYLYPKE